VPPVIYRRLLFYTAGMKALFLGCNDQLAPVWAKVMRPDDPPIDVNRKAFVRAELPRLLDGYTIALDDHSYMPTELVARVPRSSTSCSWEPARRAT
jgi:hypothetical protein